MATATYTTVQEGNAWVVLDEDGADIGEVSRTPSYGATPSNTWRVRSHLLRGTKPPVFSSKHQAARFLARKQAARRLR